MRTASIELFEAFQPMKGARIVVAHARLFCIVVRNPLMTFDDGFDGGFSFSSQPAKFCSRDDDLLVKPLSLSGALRMCRGGAFAFARQTFSLLS